MSRDISERRLHLLASITSLRLAADRAEVVVLHGEDLDSDGLQEAASLATDGTLLLTGLAGADEIPRAELERRIEQLGVEKNQLENELLHTPPAGLVEELQIELEQVRSALREEISTRRALEQAERSLRGELATAREAVAS